MILSIVNVAIAVITLGIAYYNFKFVKDEYNEKRKFKLYIHSSNYKSIVKKAPEKKITLVFENVGENELIDMGIETTYSRRPNQIFDIGKLKPNEKKSFYYIVDEVVAKHIETENQKSEIEIPISIGYFNKYFNIHINKEINLDIVIREHLESNVLLNINTKHLYLESKKENEYKQ